jgi:hypothetical protein
MNMRHRFLFACGALTLWANAAQAAQFTALSDISTDSNGLAFASSYFGVGGDDLRGAVVDGGYDAFDAFGFYPARLPSGLALNRRTELLPGNLYRWVDTFTNAGSSALSTSVEFWGNLGSDGSTFFSAVNPHFQVSHDSGIYDPVVGFIWGNNAYATTFTRNQFGDQTRITIPITLGPGESTSLMFFAFLAREVDNRILANDITLATNTVNALFASPNLSGLSGLEQSQIANWNAVPEPSTYATVGSALVLAAWVRRRRA